MPERLSRELRIVYELARVVAAGPYRVDDVLERICSDVRATFGFERALLVRYDPEAETVHAVVQQGLEWPGDEWLPISYFPFLEEAREVRMTTFVPGDRATEVMPRRVAERFGVGALVAVPMVVERRCLGFIVADHGGKDFELSDGDRELLHALGLVAAVFVDKADQYGELQRALEELKRLDDARADFISIASTLHLRGDELREEQLAELRSTLYEQTSRLRTLAEQLLDLSRIDAEAVKIAPTPFRPREACDELLPQIAPDRIDDVRVEIDPELELVSDREGVERVMANLVLNALRYGQPPIFLRCEQNGSVEFIVEDRGCGVDPQFVPHLFDRFTRSDGSRRAREPGAGLGLAIASSFAERLGGTLRYEPAEPTGARFILTLPRELRREAA